MFHRSLSTITQMTCKLSVCFQSLFHEFLNFCLEWQGTLNESAPWQQVIDMIGYLGLGFKAFGLETSEFP